MLKKNRMKQLGRGRSDVQHFPIRERRYLLAIEYGARASGPSWQLLDGEVKNWLSVGGHGSLVIGEPAGEHRRRGGESRSSRCWISNDVPNKPET